MLKQYNLQLESDVIDKLDELLDVAGMSRSGFIMAVIDQIVKMMSSGKGYDIKNLTLPEALKILGNIGRMMDKK